MKPIVHLLPLAWLTALALAAPAPASPSWEEMLPQIGDAKIRNDLRATLAKADPYPSAMLVTTLRHPQLAARLGALEMLEERAGGDFGYNPWLEPGHAANAGPLARWDQWAGNPPAKANSSTSALLSDDQRRGYLRDLLGSDENQATRARHMLETDGLAAAGFLEEFLRSQPALPAASRAKIREAQYQIVLAPRLAGQAPETAHQLVFGSRDQSLAAITQLRNCGVVALPILRDFLDHPDSLVREATIDAMLSAGEASVVSIVAPALKRETDVNVIHGAMRRLKDVPGNESLELAAVFLKHDDEDLLVSAVQTCLTLTGGSKDNPFGSSHGGSDSRKGGYAAVDAAVLERLHDPRWRVRVAALEYAAGRQLTQAKDGVLKLLGDSDEFVRFAAIKTAAALKTKAALPALKAAFLQQEAAIGPVLEGYAALDASPDAEMLAHLAKQSPEARISAIRAAESNQELLSLAKRFANDADPDVACAALRLLASDDDRTSDKDIASILVTALRSGSKEKRTAILDRLVLKKNTSASAIPYQPESSQATKPTALDPLYQGLLNPLANARHEPTDDSSRNQIANAPSALIAELAKLTADSVPSEERYRVALALARANYGIGFTTLNAMLPALNTAQKAAIGEHLDEPSHREAVALLQTLMRDPVQEIRQGAANAALSDEKSPGLIKLALDELKRPGAALQPYEVYSYHFESCLRDGSSASMVRRWAAQLLKEPRGISDPLRILACICLRDDSSSETAAQLLTMARSSPSVHVRRAAWHALGNARSQALNDHLRDIAKDPSFLIRQVIPAAANRSNANWVHYFDDLHTEADNSYYYSSSRNAKSNLSPEWVAALETLAAPTEVSDTVRFDAMFAMLAAGKKIDAAAMASLLPRQPEDSNASNKLANWFSNNTQKVGPGLRVLFEALEKPRISPSEMAQLRARLYPVGKDAAPTLTTFAALAANQQATAGASQQTATDAAPAADVKRAALPLVFFFKPGCRECAQTREMLADLKRDFPKLAITEHNIVDASGLELNEALSARFQLASTKRHIAPAVFTQSGALVRDDLTPQALASLLEKTMTTPQDDAWMAVDSGQLAAAKQEVASDYQALTIPVVAGAGLLDGINPCAFATIIFFLSYLQIARRTPREMLFTGMAFILGVFLAYFAAGLALYNVLAALHGKFAGIQRVLNPLFAGLAMLAAVLSFRDAARARAGRLEDMSLQLPGFLKDRIRGVIRTGARARRFVIAAFFAGIIISFLELACTGQVYAPIVYQIQQGRLDAMGMLLVYNLAFILPLVVIFLLAYGGLRSETLIALQKKHTFAVKLALGMLFLVLGAVILWGPRLLHG